MVSSETLPRVSVIIAAYNVEGYIERAIHSALNQNDISVEVIVIDDCSTDKTYDIVSQIADDRIRCEQLSTNQGPARARNLGFELARGEWIAVLDGDDCFMPGRLKHCLDFAQTQKANIIADNLLIFRESDKKSFAMYSKAYLQSVQHLSLAAFIRENSRFLGGRSLGYLKPIFSRAFLLKHKLKYDSALRTGEDYMLLADCLADGARCAITSVCGYQYTVRAGSISHRLNLLDIDRMLEGDSRFKLRHDLDTVSLRAQKSRDVALKDAHAFTTLIDALKIRDARTVLQNLSRTPRIIKYLWRPIWSRVKNFLLFVLSDSQQLSLGRKGKMDENI